MNQFGKWNAWALGVCFGMGAVLASGSFARADECPVEWGHEEFVERVTAAIEKASGCDQATEIAWSCAMGSSIDQLTMGAAESKCSQVFAKKPKEVALFKSLANRCAKKYLSTDGTLYRSMNASCRLTSAQLVADLNSPLEM